MKVNINALCTVKLSSWGKVYLWEYLSDIFNQPNVKHKVPEQYASMSKDGHAWHLHELCNIFGKHLFNGQTKLPFESDIEFILKDSSEPAGNTR